MYLSHSDVAAQRGPFASLEGQADAPFAVTPMPIVERMLDLAGVGPGTRLIDLGCGDGRIVVAAAKRGAVGSGVEIDPERIANAWTAARDAGVTERVRFEQGDMFAADVADFDVVTLFLLGHVNSWLEGKLRRELRPGSRLVSHAFPMPSWAPTAVEKYERTPIFLWRI